MPISEPAEYAILGLLEHRPMHGYEMFQQFQNAALGQIVHLEMSQMYAFLKKLNRLEYIASQLEPQGARPPRKVFHMTEAGRKVFLHWLTVPVERPREIRILFLIKLYFSERVCPEQSAGLVDEQLAACRRFLEHLEEQQPSVVKTDEMAFFDRVVLSSRIHQTHALLTWLQELQREFGLKLADSNA
ncbi:MAG: PadR family transcriptional regulator [Chloroflexota bacterium]|nr:PadR family transcriptional regulator [Chloroflexota bacterium]